MFCGQNGGMDRETFSRFCAAFQKADKTITAADIEEVFFKARVVVPGHGALMDLQQFKVALTLLAQKGVLEHGAKSEEIDVDHCKPLVDVSYQSPRCSRGRERLPARQTICVGRRPAGARNAAPVTRVVLQAAV